MPTLDFIEEYDLDLLEVAVQWPAEEDLAHNKVYRFECYGGDIFCETFKIHHLTPSGMVINFFNGKGKFINNSWKKKFAYPTPEEAFQAFIYRKKRQVEILEAQIEATKKQFAAARAFLEAKEDEVLDEII